MSQTIAVHGGPFHADDCFASALLSLLYPEIKIFRGVPPGRLKDFTFKIDTGLCYSHLDGCYDHHQRDFTEHRPNGVPYASFGLVWRHYGLELIRSTHESLDALVMEQLFRYIEKHLVEPVDAIDNGFFYIGVKETYRSYNLIPLDIFDVIDSFRPVVESSEGFERGFSAAVDFCKTFLENVLGHGLNVLKDHHIFHASLDEAHQKRVSYLVFERSIPFDKYFFPPSSDLDISGDIGSWRDRIIFVVYPKLRDGRIKWYVETVPLSADNRHHRKPLPELWGGLNGADLAKVSGVPGALFCHRGLFLCCASTKEGALDLLELAIASSS